MTWKLVVSREPGPSANAEVFVDEATFWGVASRRSSLSNDYFMEKVIVKGEAGRSLADLGHLTKLIRTVFTAMVDQGVDITQIATAAGDRTSSDIETFLKTAERAVNQKVDLAGLFSEFEMQRMAVLRVCRANNETKFYIPDWLRRYADGQFNEEAKRDGMVADELFSFTIKQEADS